MSTVKAGTCDNCQAGNRWLTQTARTIILHEQKDGIFGQHTVTQEIWLCEICAGAHLYADPENTEHGKAMRALGWIANRLLDEIKAK